MPDLTVETLDFHSPHEVIAYGGATHNFDRPAEVLVEVLLAPSSGVTAPPPASTIATRWIGCGQLDLVPIGSVWLNGVKQRQRTGLRSLKASVEFAGRGTLEKFGAAGQDANLLSMPCFRLKLLPSVGGLSAVWVPVAEVIRVFFGVSSHFLVQMCTGIRTPDLASDSAFFDRRLCGYVDPETFKITCTHNPENLEALTVAAMLAQAPFRYAHDSVFKEIEKAYKTNPLGGPFTMLFPFEGLSTSWKFEGRELPLRPGATVWKPALDKDKIAGEGAAERAEENSAPVQSGDTAFLVTRILHMVFPLPFSRLQIAVSRPKVVEGLPPAEGRTLHRPARRVRMQTRVPAGRGGTPFGVPSDGAVLEPSLPVEIIRLPREDESGKRRLVIFDPLDERSGSTADRQPGGDKNVTHVVINRRKTKVADLAADEDGTLPSRVATFCCITALAHERGWSILRGESDDDGLPRFDRFADKYDILIMAVGRGSEVLYIADAGTCLDDGRSLGLLRPENTAIAIEDAVERIKKAAGENGARWGSRNPIAGFKVKAVARKPPGIFNNLSRYSDLLAAALNGF